MPVFTKSSLLGVSNFDTTAAAGSTLYLGPGATGGRLQTVATDIAHTYYGAGATLRNGRCFQGTNSYTGNGTVSFYKNGAAIDPTFTMDVALDDTFISGSGSNTLSNADVLSMRVTTGANPGTLQLRGGVAELLTTSGPTLYIHQLTGDATVNSSQTYYAPIGGQAGTLATAEAGVQFRVRAAGRIKALQLTLDNTIVSGVVTVALRKNGATTALTTSAGVAQSGVDSTHSVRVAEGDLINYIVTTDVLSAGVDVVQISVEVESDNDESDLISVGSKNYAAATNTDYGLIFGDQISTWTTTDTLARTKIPFATRIGRIRVYSDLATSGTSTLRLRVNGVASALTLSVAATAAGWHESAVGVYVDVAADDVLDFEHVYSGFTGRFVMTGLTLNYEPGQRRAQSWVCQ